MMQPGTVSLQALMNALDALGSHPEPKTVDELTAALKGKMTDVLVYSWTDRSWLEEELAEHPVAFIVSEKPKKTRNHRRKKGLQPWASPRGWAPLRDVPKDYKANEFMRSYRHRCDEKYATCTTFVEINPGLYLFALVCTKAGEPIVANEVMPTRRANDSPTFPAESRSGSSSPDLASAEVLSSESDEDTPPTPVKTFTFAAQNTVVEFESPGQDWSPKRKREDDILPQAVGPVEKKSKTLDGAPGVPDIPYLSLFADDDDIARMIMDLGDDNDIFGYPVPATDMVQPLKVNMSYPTRTLNEISFDASNDIVGHPMALTEMTPFTYLLNNYIRAPGVGINPMYSFV